LPPTGGSVSVTPTTGTAGSTTFTASTSGWSGSGTITYSYSWQYALNTNFNWIQAATGTTFAPTVSQNSGVIAWRVVVTASNGTSPNGTATANFTVNNPVIQYTFALGNKISVSTNGYINLGDSSTVTEDTNDSVTNTTGLVFAVMPRNMQQTSLHYFGDASSYVVRWRGNQLNVPANIMEYEAKFYPGQQYADMYVINRFVVQDNAFAFVNNGSAVTSYPSTPINASRYRVNFNSTAPTSLPGGYSPRATSNMLLATQPTNTDIGQTTLVTANTALPPFFPPYFAPSPFFPPY
jgi:hypothetical protein